MRKILINIGIILVICMAFLLPLALKNKNNNYKFVLSNNEKINSNNYNKNNIDKDAEQFCARVVLNLSKINVYNFFKDYLGESGFVFDFSASCQKEEIYDICKDIYGNYKIIEQNAQNAGFATGLNFKVEQLDRLLYINKFSV